MLEKLKDAIVNMQEQEALALARELMEADQDPLGILDACGKALEEVGSKFETGEYFLPQLILGGEMLKQISEMLKPRLRQEITRERAGRILMGTVRDDIHDIGKDIVVFMLDVNGFEVMDLGIDVAPERFVEAIRAFSPRVVGLSGFLTIAYDSMRETVRTITEAGLRDSVKIMVGGGQVDEQIMHYAGADGYGLNAMDAVNMSRKWVGGQPNGKDT